MSLAAYEDFVYRAGWLHLADPVAAWRDFAEQAARHRRPPVRRAHAAGAWPRTPTSRSAWPAARGSPRNGERNFPDGEVFTGPIETETTRRRALLVPGHLRRPRGGGRAAAVRGRAGGQSEAAAGRSLPRPDAGHGRRRVDPGRVRDRHQLRGQAVHASRSCSTRRSAARATWRSAPAIPRRAARTAPALHWDMVCDLRSGGEIHADGELIYRDGAVPARVRARPVAAAGLSRRQGRAPPISAAHGRDAAP